MLYDGDLEGLRQLFVVRFDAEHIVALTQLDFREQILQGRPED